jgi:hypothetical protein
MAGRSGNDRTRLVQTFDSETSNTNALARQRRRRKQNCCIKPAAANKIFAPMLAKFATVWGALAVRVPGQVATPGINGYFRP